MPEALICPVCGNALSLSGNTFRCPAGHCYDAAREGYVNLLMNKSKHSAEPGDNCEMLRARRAFLQKGYYDKLSSALNKAAAEIAGSSLSPKIADSGCGEGYYTRRLYAALSNIGKKPEIYAYDISKEAVRMAAGIDKKSIYFVAGVNAIPLAENALDIVYNVFAPVCSTEYSRILKNNGRLILVLPGKGHLRELKKAVYDSEHDNPEPQGGVNGFTLEKRIEENYSLNITCAEDIQNLFRMTPYYYKTGTEGLNRLKTIRAIDTEAEFIIDVYKKV